MPAYKPLAERFLGKFDKGASDACWLWRGATLPGGYGTMGGERCGKHIVAHRYAYEQANGPIPAGMLVCHDCDTPGCVNPAHLFLGTHETNMQDLKSKGRGKGAAKPISPKRRYRYLTEDEKQGILSALQGGLAIKAIARQFSVDRKSVRNLRDR